MDYKIIAKKMAQFYRDHPGSWTQGVVARDKSGEAISALSDEAIQWCVVGLANKLAPESFTARFDLYRAIGEGHISWNDAPGRTIEQVIEKLESL